MTLDCNNIKLQKGKKTSEVKELQTLLQKVGYYSYRIDGDFGSLTEESVKKFQKKYNLFQDGIVGPITCKKINSLTSTTNTKCYYKNGIYHSGPHWISEGCNKKGQCTSYFCADCAMKQQLGKQDYDQFTQQILAGYAGTTTRGTSHPGINTALYQVAKKLGIKINVKWINFSDLGSTVSERFEALGKILINPKKGVILHTLYQLMYGHYETPQEINMNNKTVTILNSLGRKCGGSAFCGYTETRNWTRLTKELAAISQPSVCIITFGE